MMGDSADRNAALGSDAVLGIAGIRFLLWILLAAWFLGPWLDDPYRIGISQDAAYMQAHAEGAWRTWSQFHELPVWEPYSCGGIPALGNVQNDALSPSFLFSVLFGLMPGMRLAWLAFFVVGMEGGYRYARWFGVRGVGALLAGVLFALQGRFTQALYDGQTVFLGFHLVPWVLLGQAVGLRSWGAAAAGGLAMAVVFLHGGAVATPLIAMLLAVGCFGHTVAAIVRRGQPEAVAWWRPAAVLAFMGVLTAAITAVRLLPVMESLLVLPRSWHDTEAHKLAEVWAMLFEPATDGGYGGAGTSYVGVLAAVAFGYALLRLDAPAWRVFGWTAAAAWLTMGTQHFGLWTFFTHLPVLKNLRCPFRIAFFLSLFVAIGAGRAVWLVERDLLLRLSAEGWLRAWRRVPPGVLRALGAVMAMAVAVALAWPIARQGIDFNRPRMIGVPSQPTPRWVEQPFRQSLGNRWYAQIWPAAGLGTISCFEEQPFPTSALLRGDLMREEYLTEAGAGTVRRLAWSPHRIVLALDLARDATLLVNQNDHRGWRTDVGHKVAHAGLLAVAVPKGRYTLTLRHRDPLVYAGLGVSLATLAALLAWAVRARCGRRRSQDVVPIQRPGPR